MKSDNHGVLGCDCELLVDQVYESGSYRLSLHLNVPAMQSHEMYRCEPMDANPYSYFQMLFNSVEESKRDTPEMNPDRLRGHGAQLADKLLPRELQARFWNLAGSFQGRLPKLHIVSNDSSIPWELMRIRDPARGKRPSFFLVERFAISRWIRGQPGCTHLPLRRLAVVAPRDSGLPSTAWEKNSILNLTSGRDSREVPAKAATVLAAMESGQHEGWHFAGHGLAPGNFPDTWAIRLEDGRNIQVSDLADLAGLGAGKPLVFLNSCRSGRGAYVLNRVDGWAQTLVQQAGAGAFIGTHWAISDVPAAEFAVTFYRSFLGGATISDAVHEARLQIRDQFKDDPTWLAYTVFAHPEAICAVPEWAEDPSEERENDPSAPAQVASASAAVLRGGPDASGEASKTRTWPSGRVAASIAGFALLVFLLWLVTSRPAPESGAANRRPAVSVLTFQNLKPESSDLDWLTAALPEVLSAELGFDKAVRVIDREEVAAAEMSLDIPPGEPSPESLKRLRVLLGTENFVFGTYKNIGDSSQVEIDIGLWSLAEDSPIWKRRKLFDAGAWTHLNEGLASVDGELSLRRALGVPDLTSSQSAQVVASFPQQLEASRLFGEGLAHFQRYSFRQATESFFKALNLESHARIALTKAQVLIRQGRLAEAAASLEVAADSRVQLPPQEQAEWNLAQAEVEPGGQGVTPASRALFEGFFEDDVGYALDLASQLTDQGEALQAQRLLEEIKKSQPLGERDLNFTLVASKVQLILTNFEAALAQAENAIKQSRTIKATWEEGVAHRLKASILVQLDRQPEAFASYGESVRLLKRFGDEFDTGFFFVELLARLDGTGNPERAEEFLRLGLAEAEKLGDLRSQARVLSSLSAVLLTRGDVTGSREAAEKAGEVLGTLKDGVDGHVEVNNGYRHFLAGELAKAKADFELASAIFSASGDNVSSAIVSLNLGEVAIYRGNFQDADEHFKMARSVFEKSNLEVYLAHTESLVGTLRLAEGDNTQAEKIIAAAAKDLKDRNEDLASFEALQRLAYLHLTRGESAKCSRAMGLMVRELETSKAWNLLAQAYTILSRCRLAEGRKVEARELLSLAIKVEITDFRVASLLLLASAYLSASEGRGGEAVQELLEFEKQAEAKGHYLFALEARLAAAEIEFEYGNQSQGIEWLQAIVHQARSGKKSQAGSIEKRALAILEKAKALPAAKMPLLD